MADDKGFDWAKLDVGGAPANQPARETVVVHCANGHRLVVPAALAGKWGKCSRCQAAFQIPAAGELKGGGMVPPPSPPQHGDVHAAPAAEVQAVKPAEAAPDMFVGIGGTPASASAIADFPRDAAPRGDEKTFAPDETVRERPVPSAVSVATLVCRLWEEVEHGGIVELHITGGSTVLPKWFEPRWSGGTHGLFATEAVDGRVTLTAIAWSTIEKVVVKNLDDLPDGMFD